jgi:hypothetical protein
MDVNFELLESQLSEAEMALFIAVNVALNATVVAGADPSINLTHLAQHKENFDRLGKNKAQHILAALEMLHRNTAGL